MKVYETNKDEGFDVSDDIVQDFHEKGFIIVKSLLSKEEVANLLKTVEGDSCFKRFNYQRDDGAGRKARIVLWNKAGDDVTGVIARCEKVAGTMEKLLGGEVYHYHSKVIMKDAHTGGMHVWHQDYAYWYKYGCPLPNMGTVFIAADKAHKGNGCLKILQGSHKLGRVDHVRIGDQNGIADEIMTGILQNFEITHVELEPGDALFFHCNIMHKSDQNNSGDRRWALLCAYNRADNQPVGENPHSNYEKMIKMPNSFIANCKATVNFTEKDFFNLSHYISLKDSNEKEQ